MTATLDSDNSTALTIATDSVALTTDTTGNYVANVNTSVLTGLTGGSAGSEGASLTLALDYSQALSGDVGLAADAAVFGQSGFVFEGSSANTIETFLVVTNPTSSDKTITFPDASGTVILSGHSFTGGDISGTLDTDGTTALTIDANSVALGTDTTGNYVSSATASGGLVMTGTEGASLGILLQPSGDALSSTTSSGSGLELLSTGLTLLQGCATGEVLKWNETTDLWECGSAGATYLAGSGLTLSSLTFSLGGTLTSDATLAGAFDLVLNNAASELKILESTGATFYGIFDVADLAADRTYTFPDASGTVLLSGGTLFTAAGTSGSSQTIAQGDTLTIAAGTGITTTGGSTDTITIAATLGTDIDNTEIVNDTIKEVDLDLSTHAGAGEDGYLLAYDNSTGGFSWISPGTAGVNYWTDGGAVTYLTATTDDFAIGGSTLAGSIFGIDESAGTFYFAADNSANPTLTFEATDSDTGDFGFNTNDSFYISGANFGIGDTSPLSLFTVGSGDLFQVSSTGGAVTIAGVADGTDALTLTAGDILVGNGDLDISGGDFNVTLDSADEVDITKSAGAAATEEGLDLAFTAGAGDGSDIYSVLRIAATSANHSASSDKLYGINIANLGSADAEGDEAAIFVGTGWDSL
ncbi:MAG: hypothetical protein E6R05_02640, partial [Candidatus Moraniibacteriota bacterium]